MPNHERSNQTMRDLAAFEGSADERINTLKDNVSELWDKFGHMTGEINGSGDSDGLRGRIKALETQLKVEGELRDKEVSAAKKAGKIQAGSVGGIFAIIEILHASGVF